MCRRHRGTSIPCVHTPSPTPSWGAMVDLLLERGSTSRDVEGTRQYEQVRLSRNQSSSATVAVNVYLLGISSGYLKASTQILWFSRESTAKICDPRRTRKHPRPPEMKLRVCVSRQPSRAFLKSCLRRLEQGCPELEKLPETRPSRALKIDPPAALKSSLPETRNLLTLLLLGLPAQSIA